MWADLENEMVLLCSCVEVNPLLMQFFLVPYPANFLTVWPVRGCVCVCVCVCVFSMWRREVVWVFAPHRPQCLQATSMVTRRGNTAAARPGMRYQVCGGACYLTRGPRSQCDFIPGRGCPSVTVTLHRNADLYPGTHKSRAHLERPLMLFWKRRRIVSSLNGLLCTQTEQMNRGKSF